MAAETAATLMSVPTILWSGVVGALVSLTGAVVGVVLSNRSGEQRLDKQLRHDAAEKQRDRVASLRKDVYLKLFEEFSAASGHLSSLAGKDPVTENIGEPLQGVIAQLGKVQLVGMQQTALLAGELTSLYGEALIRLLVAAKPMHDLKIDIGIADKAYQEQLAEIQRITQEIRSINEAANRDPDKVLPLQASRAFFQRQWEESAARRSDAWGAFNALQQPFMESVFAELKVIAPAQAKLMAAMREEVGLTADPELMLERLEATELRMRNAVGNLFANLAEDK